jgi:hypothetical protein
MPSRFDLADQRASESIGRMMETLVTWRPMRARPAGGMTGGSLEPDPARPVRKNLGAVVSWEPQILMAGLKSEGGGTLVTADVLVDFDRTDFADGVFPEKDDWFELSDPYRGNTTVQVEVVGDDGSARVVYACVFPE